ncbi:hypothetical protein [Leptolyngbya sp. CCY15150]|uniref:hypothetical protein n=1 Tax=Leptolyngbya sp. CCY15150 TaxID=2767772 RepID=UPI00194DF280|nr:hypothetical protein [Leptolyngbya sp. CCY15150]
MVNCDQEYLCISSVLAEPARPQQPQDASIILQKVTFLYREDHPARQDVSLTIPVSKVTA